MRAKTPAFRCLVGSLLLTAAGILCQPAPAAAGAPISPGDDPRPAQQIHPRLEAGRLLIADRSLPDPNFAETVVLLLRVTDSGTIGVVINDLTEARVAHIFPQIDALAESREFARYGGPVETHSALVLLRTPDPPEAGERIFADVWLAPGEAALRQAVADDATSFRVYLGYAGWAAGQLEAEVARHDWQILPAEASWIFDKPAPEIWPELIRHSRALLASRRLFSRLHPAITGR